MAATLVSVDVNELEKQRLGYGGISLTDWTVTTVSQYASGSKWEDAGALYELTGNENMGTAGEWAGIGNSNLVYSYFVPGTLDCHWTTTAPTWDTAKQGWYGTGGAATYRYLASVYKDAGGNYTQKTILIDRQGGVMYEGYNFGGQAANADHRLRFATDASVLWDESEDVFVADKNIRDAIVITSTGNQVVGGGSSWVIPAGRYIIGAPSAGSGYATFQIQIGGVWYWCANANSFGLGYIISDGVNMRIYNNNGATATTIYWAKF